MTRSSSRYAAEGSRARENSSSNRNYLIFELLNFLKNVSVPFVITPQRSGKTRKKSKKLLKSQKNFFKVSSNFKKVQHEKRRSSTLTMVLPSHSHWNMQHDTSILLIRTLRIDCCCQNWDWSSRCGETPILEPFIVIRAVSKICRLTDAPVMWTPLKNANRHSYPTNRNLADRLLLSDLRCDQWLLRNANIGAPFEAVFDQSNFHPLENHDKMYNFTWNSSYTLLWVCLTILSTESIDKDVIVTSRERGQSWQQQKL